MSLSSNAQALLNACAVAIVTNDPVRYLDPYPLLGAFGMGDEVVQYLAGKVESASDSKWTIRRTSAAFFDVRVKGVNLYLALCPYDTPHGEVAELTDEMRLVSLGPYSDGLDVDAKRAFPEAVQRYQDFVAERASPEAVQRELAQADVEKFMTWLEDDSPDIAAELRSRLNVTLEDLAIACRKHEFPLMMLLLERNH